MAAISAGQGPTHEAESQTRSFEGCNTCRSRRVKCDEARPSCSQCRKSGLHCGGYGKTIYFDFEEDHERTRFRRPLFSEEARREMSEQLTSSIPGRLLPWHLAQLDEESQSMPIDKDINVFHGPFGAFKVTRSGSSTTVWQGPSTTLSHGTLQVSDTARGRHDPVLSSPDFLTSMPVDTLLHSILDTADSDLPTYLTDLGDSTLDADNVIQGSTEAITIPSTDFPSLSHDEQASQYVQFSELMSYSHVDQHTPTPTPTTVMSCMPTPHAAAPKNAGFLLQYFSTTLLSFLTPIRHEKTPWQILFLPYMRDCLALLTLGQPVDHAGMCTFYGLLAISARSLGGVHNSQLWLEQGEAYRQRAYQHCEIMLRTAYDLPKRYKYKSVLIALQIMVLISTLGGDPVTEEYYFLEAEKFIKLKGLGRKSSRKVRLLHQCYAFERLMYESTCMRGIDFKQRNRVCNDIRSVSVVPYPEDSMAFRPPNWDNLDEEISKANSPEESEADLESEILGLSPEAFCSNVSGLPKHWILLILHIVLLGKEKDSAEQNRSSGSLDLQEFLGRAKKLERCINQHAIQREWPAHHDEHAADGRPALGNMLDAIGHCLQIYFYRRIYEVNTSWLQDKVVKVRDCLLRCETVDPNYEMSGCVGLLWASFIASCEAEDPQIQNSFSGWYQRAAKRTGMSCWLNSLDLSEQIWSEKQKSRGTKLTWIDVLRRHQRQRIPAYTAVA
ncbi:Fc.00g070900.m01.CDS01 [Cosmosporella sp. VM-42]